ncbi:MAG: hypothetical protein ACLQGU_02535 [bacterium]
MNQENQESAITPFISESDQICLPSFKIPPPEERGKVIDSPTQPYRSTGSQTEPEIANATYISATDPHRWQTQQQPSRKFPWEKSFGGLAAPDKAIFDLAFSRISQALETEFEMSELSNCFDEWKILLETASRKVESFTANHRKILGALLPIIAGKDISDFDIETLQIFRDATNVLRTPRTIKLEARRIIGDLLKRMKIMMPLGVDESAKDKVQELNNVVDHLILKSRTDR